MTAAALEYIGNRLAGAGIPYAFMRWEDDDFPETYFIGSYIENDTGTTEENGHFKTIFILRGYTRGSWLLLEQTKEKIRKNIPVKDILSDGSAICISYLYGEPAPTADADIKSIKIDLQIDEWRVK